jgi:hypothetical protein
VLHLCRRRFFGKDATVCGRGIPLAVCLARSCYTTSAARLVINHPTQTVELKVTAIQQELFELLPRSLHAGFRAGKGETQTSGQIALGEPLILGEIERLAIGFG